MEIEWSVFDNAWAWLALACVALGAEAAIGGGILLAVAAGTGATAALASAAGHGAGEGATMAIIAIPLLAAGGVAIERTLRQDARSARWALFAGVAYAIAIPVAPRLEDVGWVAMAAALALASAPLATRLARTGTGRDINRYERGKGVEQGEDGGEGPNEEAQANDPPATR